MKGSQNHPSTNRITEENHSRADKKSENIGKCTLKSRICIQVFLIRVCEFTFSVKMSALYALKKVKYRSIPIQTWKQKPTVRHIWCNYVAQLKIYQQASTPKENTAIVPNITTGLPQIDHFLQNRSQDNEDIVDADHDVPVKRNYKKLWSHS